MTTRNLKLNITPGGAPVVVRVSQYENDSRTLRFQLVGNEEMLSIPAGTTAKVEGTKPSGKGFSYDCSLSGTEVTVTIKDQMTAESGRMPCEVVLRNGTTRLGAGRFELEVEPAGLKAGTITSSDTFASIIRDEVRECANEQLIVLTVDPELSSESSAPVANSTLCNFFAGALKGRASGASVTVDDVSPIEHNPKVWVHGKNLIPLPYVGTFGKVNGLTFTDNGDGTITVNGTVTDNFAVVILQRHIALKDGVTYYINTETNSSALLLAYRDAEGVVRYARNGPLTWSDNYTFVQLYLQYPSGQTVNEVVKPYIVIGTTATAYEPWVDPTGFTVTDGKGNTYTPNTDGTVEGVTSTSPTMTLSTDTEGAIIECEYNRDLTAAIERIEAALFN